MKNFLKEKLIHYPYLFFTPFLLLFLLIIIKFHSPILIGDESRYVYFATNLSNGYYSPPAPNINLWNGPGYPMFLVPFVILKLSPIYAVLMNAVFYYLSIVLLFKILKKFVSLKIAFIGASFWGFYYNSYQDMLLMYTETIAAFLITSFLYFVVKIFEKNPTHLRRNILFAGLILGYLILTKIIFSYVLIVLLIIYTLLFIFNTKKVVYKRTVLVMLFAFITIFPYLAYTYSITGRAFYFGNSGGMSLYWMSTLNDDEYGDWFDEYYLQDIPKQKNLIQVHIREEKRGNHLEVCDSLLKLSHAEEYNEIFKYEGIERDDKYKEIAIKNIKENPMKFVRNCVSNIGRLIVGQPYSYTLQSNKNLLRLPMSGLLFALFLFSLIPTFKNWKKLLFPLQLTVVFLVVYLCCTIVLSAYTRMFTIIVPLLIFWITFILERSIKIDYKFNEEIDKKKSVENIV